MSDNTTSNAGAVKCAFVEGFIKECYDKGMTIAQTQIAVTDYLNLANEKYNRSADVSHDTNGQG